MTPELASFSDWALALLPRLFLYPGGLALIVVLLVLRFASSGKRSILGKPLLSELSRANLLSLAVAWVAVALAPLPGASNLPSAPDKLVLAALPALSLLLDTPSPSYTRLFAGAAITLALLLPAVDAGSLLAPTGDLLLLALFSLAVLTALVSLSWGRSEIAGQVRWLAWFCLGVVPLWEQLVGDSAWGAGLFVLAGTFALNATPWPQRGIANDELRITKPGEVENQSSTNAIRHSGFPLGTSLVIRNSRRALAIAWLLALLGLLVALLTSS